MKQILPLLFLLAGITPAHAQPGGKRVLVFTKVTGYCHESIPAVIKAIQKLGVKIMSGVQYAIGNKVKLNKLTGVVGRGLPVNFKSSLPGNNPIAGIASVEDGAFVNGSWVAGRWLNGDEILSGKGLRLRGDYYMIQKIKLYRYH
ncbi:MAG: DUF5597 domain-containing protein [Bacteroidota bacterium]